MENKYAYNWDVSGRIYVCCSICCNRNSVVLTIVNIFGDNLQNNWSVINLLDNGSDTVNMY